MLSLVLFSYDPIAIWGLAVAIIGVVVGIVAAIAAIAAAHYAKEAPTADDLARVEENTAHLEEVRSGIASVAAQMKRQEDAEALTARARLVSVSVSGDNDVNEPFPVSLTTTTERVSFTRIEFRSELGNTFGAVECQPQGNNPRHFIATIPWAQVANWRGAGTSINYVTTRQVLRVWMTFDGQQPTETYRDMSVMLTHDSGNPVAGTTMQHRKATYRIQGTV